MSSINKAGSSSHSPGGIAANTEQTHETRNQGQAPTIRRQESQGVIIGRLQSLRRMGSGLLRSNRQPGGEVPPVPPLPPGFAASTSNRRHSVDSVSVTSTLIEGLNTLGYDEQRPSRASGDGQITGPSRESRVSRMGRAMTRVGHTPPEKLNAAARDEIARGDGAKLRQALANGADPTAQSSEHKNNAFHFLAKNPTTDTIRILRDWGLTNPDRKPLLGDALRALNSKGRSPLHVMQFNIGRAHEANDGKSARLLTEAFNQLSPYAGSLENLVDGAGRHLSEMQALGQQAQVQRRRVDETAISNLQDAGFL